MFTLHWTNGTTMVTQRNTLLTLTIRTWLFFKHKIFKSRYFFEHFSLLFSIPVMVRWLKNCVRTVWCSMIIVRIRKNAIYHSILTVHNDQNCVSGTWFFFVCLTFIHIVMGVFFIPSCIWTSTTRCYFVRVLIYLPNQLFCRINRTKLFILLWHNVCVKYFLLLILMDSI